MFQLEYMNSVREVESKLKIGVKDIEEMKL